MHIIIRKFTDSDACGHFMEFLNRNGYCTLGVQELDNNAGYLLTFWRY